MIRPVPPGELHRHLHGKQIDHVLKTSELLVLHCTDGSELRIAWVDDAGKPVSGEPAIAYHGLRIQAQAAVVNGRT